MAYGVLSTWRVTNMAKANSNLPAPETPTAPVPRTKLNSKALPFQTAGLGAFFNQCSQQMQPYPSDVGGFSSKPTQFPQPAQLGRFLPASSFVGYMPVPDQACSDSAVAAPVHDAVPPPSASLNETPVIENEDAANDLDEIRTQMSDASSTVLAHALGEESPEESTDATVPSSGDELHPLPPASAFEQGPIEEAAVAVGGHSPGSRRNVMPVRNTFVHYPIGEDNKERRHSAPAMLTAALVHTKYPEMERAHIGGACRPCYYFVKKQDGCRWGGECQFCHLCPPGSKQRKKKERVKAIEAQKVFEERRQLPPQKSYNKIPRESEEEASDVRFGYVIST